MYWFVAIVIVLVFVLQLPLLVDLLRVILPGRSITRLTSKLTSLLLVYFMNLVFIIVLGYFLFVFLPLTVGDIYSTKGVCHIVFALWLWLNVVVNHHYAVFVHPGEAKQGEGPAATTATKVKPNGTKTGTAATTETKAKPNGTRTGTEPPAPRNGLEWQPKVSHYCSVCKVQVSYMDHHCPFTNNCVGERNYSYFILGLTYGTVGLAYAAIMSYPPFRECVVSMAWAYLRFGRRGPSDFCARLSVHSMIFVAVFAGLLSASFMLVVQWFLLLSDVPTCEVLKHFNRLPVFRLMWHRLSGKKFLEPNSRLNTLLLKQRPNPLWLLLPVRNIKPKVE